MTEHPRPGLMARLAAAMRGEIAATTVEAYRRAGAAAYQDMLDAERLRADLAAFGGSQWIARSHQASQLLCAWNAFALQTLGDQLVEADYQADPRTAGFLPPVTAEQAAVFLGEVEQWSARARRAASDETYDITAEIYLVRRPVTIAGQRLRQMQQFTFDVSAEEMAEGGQFVRRLLPGPFHDTSEVDYCDPTAD